MAAIETFRRASMSHLLSRVCIALTLVLVMAASPLRSPRAGEPIAVDAANPPFMYAAQGWPAGIYPAIVQEAFRRFGETAEMDALPWRRALAELDAGRTGVAGIYKNAERLVKYDYSDKLFDEVLQVYVRADDPFVFSGVASLRGRAVGVTLGWSYGDAFDAASKAGVFQAEPVAGDAMNFSKLVERRIDTVVAIREAAAAIIASAGLGSRVRQLGPPLSSNAAFLAFAKSAEKVPILVRFNRELAAMRKDGSFDRLVAGVVKTGG